MDNQWNSKGGDRFVVYRCPDEPDKYIAHSLETDQIGIGEAIEEAVLDLIQVLRALFKHSDDPWRQAPKRILDLYNDAEALPEIIWEEIKRRSEGNDEAELGSRAERFEPLSKPVSRDISQDTLYAHVLQRDVIV